MVAGSRTEDECEEGVVAEQQQSAEHGAQVGPRGAVMQQGQTVLLQAERSITV